MTKSPFSAPRGWARLQRDAASLTLAAAGIITTTVVAFLVHLFRPEGSVAGWLFLPLVIVFTLRWGRRAGIGLAIAWAVLADLAILLFVVRPAGSLHAIDSLALGGITLGMVLFALLIGELNRRRVLGERRLVARAAQLQLGAIVEALDDAIIDRTLDGTIVSWNAAAEHIYGYTAAEAIGQPSSILLPRNQSTEEQDILRGVQQGERIDHFETEHIAKDGRRLQLSLTIAPVKNIDDEIIGTSTIARDITEQKGIQAALFESEARLQVVVETTNEGFWLVDRGMRTLRANTQMANLLGTSVEDLLGHTVLDFCFPEDVPLMRERIEKILLGFSDGFDLRFRRSDGTSVFVLALTNPVRNADGQVIGALGMFTNVAERLRSEEERKQLAASLQMARGEAEAAQHRLALLTLISQDIAAAAADLQTVLDTVARRTAEALGDGCMLRLLSFDSQRLETAALYFTDPASLAYVRQSIDSQLRFDEGVDRLVMQSGQPLLLPTLEELPAPIEPAERQYLQRLGVHSLLVVPVRTRNRLLGTLRVSRSTHAGPFTAEDQLLLQTLADRVGLAIDHA